MWNRGRRRKIKVSQDLHREKGKKMSIEVSSTLTSITELLRGQESIPLGLLDEQIEAIKVEKLPKYSSHFIPVHDSLLDK